MIQLIHQTLIIRAHVKIQLSIPADKEAILTLIPVSNNLSTIVYNSKLKPQLLPMGAQPHHISLAKATIRQL